MRKLHSILGSITFLLFLIHGILMSLVLFGSIPYNTNYKILGIALAVVIGIHIVVSIVYNATVHTPVEENPFHAPKAATGFAIILLFIFHLNTYHAIHIVDYGNVVSAITELLLLFTCILHTRFTVRGICYSRNIKEPEKIAKISHISCGIATILLVFMGAAVFKFYL